ncbi:hypothetical protein Fcan01_19056 [Folsomia candida]|uniref:Uncharacterized protein n=1 Tax=Folsomia candida TaxID=158441 RepID=A0A226DN73_FOLCA|nr:hypothetical protein Fcan01_19056 [Folsomia candida]
MYLGNATTEFEDGFDQKRFGPVWGHMSGWGIYNATGSVLGTYPISGASSWRLTSSTFIYFTLVTSNPEISFNPANLTGSFDALLTPETEQFEAQILSTIAQHVALRTTYDNLLFYSVLHRYLQDAFAATPVTDVITWPAPSTTAWDDTTTWGTTPWDTTVTPTTTPRTTPYPTTDPTTPYPTTETTTTVGTTTNGYTPCTHLESITSEGMNNFLVWSLNNYPQYLINNGLDPTAPLINPMALHVNSSFLRLDGTFRNTADSNMSRDLFVQHVESEFVTSSFSLEVYFPRVSLNGFYCMYEEEGEIVSIYPISGLGNWQIRDFSLGLTIRISGFAIEDGYINIRSYSNREIILDDPVSDVANNVLFPDLVTVDSADGLGIEVLGILGQVVPEMLERAGKHPIANSVLDYLNFRFSALGDPYDDGLRRFITYKMLGFQDWFIEEGQDPIRGAGRFFALSVSTGLFNLHGEISNTSWHGYSMNGYADDPSGETSFTNTLINLRYIVETGGVSGNYDANGSVLGRHPIGGKSWYHLRSSGFYTTYRENFYLENGYIRLNDTHPPESVLVTFNLTSLTGSFTGLLTPDTEQYESQILRTLADRIPQMIVPDNLELFSAFRRYLKEAFTWIPVTDIINWVEPSTSPRPTTSGPTTPYPTTGPTTTIDTTTDGVTSCSNLDSITSEGMNNFLTWSLNNYPQYLINNGLDPTRPIITPMAVRVDNSFLRLDGTFRNTVGSNMSGAYEAEGKIVSMYPISGLGNWQIRDFSLGLTIRISGFAIEDGYINIRSYSNREIVLNDPISDVANHVLFPDLVTADSADGLGIEVLGILGEMFEREVKHPIANSVLDYLNFKFSVSQ